MDRKTISFVMLFVIATSASIITHSFLPLIITGLIVAFALLLRKIIIILMSKNVKKAFKEALKASGNAVKKVFDVIKKISKKLEKNDVFYLILSILSIFFGSLWYLGLGLSIPTLIRSIRKIKENGSVLAKITTIFSIIGIVWTVYLYITFIWLIIVFM
jgi:hypothetical protein